MADSLSHLPEPTLNTVSSLFNTSCKTSSKTTLELDTELLTTIKDGHLTDPFISKLINASAGMNIIKQNWFLVYKQPSCNP
jgi:hypothetical protein